MRAAKPMAVVLLAVSSAALPGCAGWPSAVADPDFALCAQARAQALRDDPAFEATLDRMRDLRNYHRCRYDLMLRDRGIEPNST